jgi:NADH-quinone oxidoreductase subunit C
MDRNELTTYLTEKFPDKIELLESGPVEPFFLLKNKDDLLDFCLNIKNDIKIEMDFLCNIAAVDTGEMFELVYSVASVRHNIRFDFKITMPFEGAEIESVQKIWPAANWHEREIWELFGINILNHDNLKRFLLPDDWDQGYPMRKDWDAPDFERLPEF